VSGLWAARPPGRVAGPLAAFSSSRERVRDGCDRLAVCRSLPVDRNPSLPFGREPLRQALLPGRPVSWLGVVIVDFDFFVKRFFRSGRICYSVVGFVSLIPLKSSYWRTYNGCSCSLRAAS
jgi:hypothetical protein